MTSSLTSDHPVGTGQNGQKCILAYCLDMADPTGAGQEDIEQLSTCIPR